MRYLPVLFACLPSLLWAEDIPLQSTIRDVVLYPQGATITREVAFEAPAGEHKLVLTDLPRNTPLAQVRVEVQGATMGSVVARNDYLPPVDPDSLTRTQELEDRIDALEADIKALDAQSELVLTRQNAAQARVRFLEQLGQGDAVASIGVEALAELTDMVGQKTQEALVIVHETHQERLALAEDRNNVVEDLQRAQQALAAAQAGTDAPRAVLSVSVSAAEATSGTALITYTINEASWTPVYDLRLTRDSGALSIERGAFISQYSGENWEDVQLTLSTVRPSEQTAPSAIWPWQRRIFDPSAVLMREMADGVAEVGAFRGAALAEPAPALQAAAITNGISVSYAYPTTVSIANRADRLRIALGTIDAQVDLTAQAVPLSDTSAFLMAGLKNETDEVILPTSEAMFYLDDRFVGQSPLPLIPAGAEADLSFGPIDGLTLSHVILERREGDRGMITKSNEAYEHARMRVENLTGEAWPLRVLGQVPYSEQENLVITWEADMEPGETNVDDMRGVLAWSFDLAPGEAQEINLKHTIKWPGDQSLQ